MYDADLYDERLTEFTDAALALGYTLSFRRDAHGWQAMAIRRGLGLGIGLGRGTGPTVAARTMAGAAELAVTAIREPRRLAA